MLERRQSQANYGSFSSAFHRTIRRAFDRALGDPTKNGAGERINMEQCRCALNFLGCSQNLLQIENLSDIVKSHRDMSKTNNRSAANAEISIDFEEFCVLTSYLTILQEEISESGCVSPIKGTNLPPPPIFLSNAPGKWSLKIKKYHLFA